MRRVTIDIVTQDPVNDEVVMYLVDDGPWPDDDAGWIERLRPIQEWLYGAADAAIDGHLAARYPDMRGKKVRIQVDSPSGCPPQLESLVQRFQQALAESHDYREAVLRSEFISGLRVVTGHQMGRFG